MVDTDILSEFLRGSTKVAMSVNEYLSEFSHLNFSIITYYEILNGFLYKDAKKQLKKFNEFVEYNNITPLTVESVKQSAKIQADLRKKGIEIGHTDTLIAGIAIINNFPLVTNNTNHFNRIKGLELLIGRNKIYNTPSLWRESVA